MSFTYSPKIVTDGLVFYVDPANPNSYVSGSTVVDSLVSNTTGSLINDTDFSADNQGSWVFGGTDDYINLGDAISIVGYSLPMTIDLWVNFVDTSTNLSLFNLDSTSPYNGIWCNITGSVGGTREVQVSFGDGGGASSSDRRTAQTTTGVNTLEFVNITLIVNGATDFEIYFNGVIQPITLSGVGGIINWSGGDGYIGNFNNSLFMNGSVSSFKVYSNALTSTEVLQNYNALKGRFGL
jgi:hypothetical protein